MSPARGWLCVCVWMAPESELDGRDEEPEEEGAPREAGQRLPAAKGVDGESHRDDEDRDREDERAWERGGGGEERGEGSRAPGQPPARRGAARGCEPRNCRRHESASLERADEESGPADKGDSPSSITVASKPSDWTASASFA